MSRTKRGSKPPGYDYWSRRPMSGSRPSPSVKKTTHKIERAQSRTLVRKEKEQAEDG